MVDVRFDHDQRPMVLPTNIRIFVKALVRWATGKRLTNRLPKLSLIKLGRFSSFFTTSSIWVLTLYFLTREFQFLTLIFLGTLDFWLIRSGGYWWVSCRKKLRFYTMNFDFLVSITGSKTCWCSIFWYRSQVRRHAGRIRNGFLWVGLNVSDIGTAIEAGIQAGGMKYLVLAGCPISSLFRRCTKVWVMIKVCTSIVAVVLENECILFDYIEVVYCQDISYPARWKDACYGDVLVVGWSRWDSTVDYL